MESGARGCEVYVGGKVRTQRAKGMKFKDGYMISSGYPSQIYTDVAVRHVLLRQGTIVALFCLFCCCFCSGLANDATLRTPSKEAKIGLMRTTFLPYLMQTPTFLLFLVCFCSVLFVCLLRMM